MRLQSVAASGGLLRRLLRAILLFSLGFTLLAGGVQLTLEYRRSMLGIEARLEMVRLGYLESLERSLWDLNREQLEVQLRGLADFPDIAWVRLESPDMTLQKGRISASEMLPRTRFPLEYRLPDGESRVLGALEVGVDRDAIHRRLYASGLGNLLWMGLFLCGLAMTLSWVFHRMVTRHLMTMADFSRRLAEGRWGEPLALGRRPRRKRDEIDSVAHALDELRLAIIDERNRREADHLALRDKRDALQRMVEQRTASLHRAKEQAEAANRAKSRFLATISHELRTPLTGILGMAELLRSASLRGEERRRLQALHQAGEGLLAILDDLLDLAKLEGDRTLPEPVVFSPAQLLDEVLTLLSPRAEAKETSLNCTLDPRLGEAFLGPEQFLRQVLTNLLANAIKFTEAGRVEMDIQVLEVQGQRQRLRFTVRDDGIGIPEAIQGRIFERFVQADEMVARRYGGAGLGLAICQHLVAAMGGRIELASREGEGSRFWFELDLPLALLDVEPVEPSADNVGKQTPLRVLVVEDMALNREVIQGLLEREGHRVTLAEDAKPALAACCCSRFDLILLDVQLPSMSGIELCRRLRADSAGCNRHTPIYAFTASLQAARVQCYLAAGMQGVIAKPIRGTALRQVLAGIRGAGDCDSLDSVAGTASDLLDLEVLRQHSESLGEIRVARLLALLQTSLREQGQGLVTALTEGELPAAMGLAHRLVSACESLGANQLATLLRLIEIDAERGNRGGCDNHLQALCHLLPLTERAIAEALAVSHPTSQA
ncbi:ATP-binding protein [Bisbaumannia pacifica]|uniref:histidine kinase n=1 Tax=Bisbaumannia pacifica TaxID=77098 RepID=A0ABD4L6G1_9GAMM|nr:ATP-binding protein [Halomonas pacifica]MBH8581903.1 response regulator [Halomonas pacifica]